MKWFQFPTNGKARVNFDFARLRFLRAIVSIPYERESTGEPVAVSDKESLAESIVSIPYERESTGELAKCALLRNAGFSFNSLRTGKHG